MAISLPGGRRPLPEGSDRIVNRLATWCGCLSQGREVIAWTARPCGIGGIAGGRTLASTRTNRSVLRYPR